MNTDVGSVTAEPNVLASIWHRRLLVLSVVVIFGVEGFLVASFRPKEYTAEASLLLSEPTPTASDAARDEARYVADQVAVMKSTPVAERAGALLSLDANPTVIDPRDVQRKTSISASVESNFVVVSFHATDPRTAAAGANAIVRAYEQATRAALEADASQKLEKLDAAIAAASENSSGGSGAQFSDDNAALLERLKAQRALLQTNAALTDEGVAAFYPAESGKAEGPSSLLILASSMLLGALIGSGTAYWRGARKREFFDQLEPQAVLGVPLLVRIPDFSHGQSSLKLPVLSAQETKSAREFRYLASSIMFRSGSSDRAERGATSRESGGTAPVGRLIAFVSACRGDGATTAVANTAFAAAQEGNRVLALDADVETQDLTEMLLGEEPSATDGADGAVGNPVDGVRHGSAPTPRWVMGTSSGGTVSLLEWGSTQALATMESLRAQFDLVVADIPPMLDGASANALLSTADGVIVVVPHRGEAIHLKQMLNRLDLLGIRSVGYVYNVRPSRRKKRTAPSRSRILSPASETRVEPRPRRIPNLVRLAKRR